MGGAGLTILGLSLRKERVSLVKSPREQLSYCCPENGPSSHFPLKSPFLVPLTRRKALQLEATAGTAGG